MKSAKVSLSCRVNSHPPLHCHAAVSTKMTPHQNQSSWDGGNRGKQTEDQ